MESPSLHVLLLPTGQERGRWLPGATWGLSLGQTPTTCWSLTLSPHLEPATSTHWVRFLIRQVYGGTNVPDNSPWHCHLHLLQIVKISSSSKSLQHFIEVALNYAWEQNEPTPWCFTSDVFKTKSLHDGQFSGLVKNVIVLTCLSFLRSHTNLSKEMGV